MRAPGSRVGVGEVLAGHRALAAVPPAAARDALRSTLCASRRDLLAFEAAWASLTVGQDVTGSISDLMEAAKQVLPRTAVASSTAPQGLPPEPSAEPLPAAWSAEELLLHKDFAAYTT